MVPARKLHLSGTHRVLPPGETWRSISPHLSDFGITRLADITGLDDIGIPVYQAVRPKGEVLSVSQGKGLTRELARLSAAMEAIEKWHAERPPVAITRGSALDVGCPPNLLGALHHRPGSLVTEHTVFEWLEGFGIISRIRYLAPVDLVRLSAFESREWEPVGFVTSTNGLASGNSLAEATLHGLCEVLERHCLGLAARNPAEQRLAIDPASVDDPECRLLLDCLDKASVRFELVDVSLDAVEVPAYRVSIDSPLGARHGVRFAGSGCHPDRGIALSRALTEAVQSRLTMIAGAREDLVGDIFERERSEASYRSPPPPSAVVGFDRIQSCASDDVEVDLNLIALKVRALTGFEPFLIDLTRPRFEVPVVKVVAPGLLGEDPGLDL